VHERPRVALKLPGVAEIWLPIICRLTLLAMTLITTPFGFGSTAAELVAGIDLTGKRAIVTGASSGIGGSTVVVGLHSPPRWVYERAIQTTAPLAYGEPMSQPFRATDISGASV
jgi:hypothetical protein